MDAIECLKTRRSVRSYTNQPVPREVIEDIVDAGRLAASAINIQPWQFIVVTDSRMRQKLADITDHGKFIADAPVCIVVFCEDCKYYLEDGSAATQNILNAAKAHGLGSCWIAGDKKPYADQIRDLLGLPENYKLISLITIGHAASIPNPEKKTLSSVMHWERFSG
ncbi:MAG TPA: nitroreductase family protein [Armatimonadota bacterium]|jgi:nitroreductase|nr:nitroreductase family protein [Armatimonadota bacterium]HOM72758.1 nitroreductase family protein [Armatimonadota bacterium]HPP74837.1 nitroreductase family protein [Armatimonadota bacterium]